MIPPSNFSNPLLHSMTMFWSILECLFAFIFILIIFLIFISSLIILIVLLAFSRMPEFVFSVSYFFFHILVLFRAIWLARLFIQLNVLQSPALLSMSRQDYSGCYLKMFVFNFLFFFVVCVCVFFLTPILPWFHFSNIMNRNMPNDQKIGERSIWWHL